jgi:hypothetical protein
MNHSFLDVLAGGGLLPRAIRLLPHAEKSRMTPICGNDSRLTSLQHRMAG